MEIVRPPDVETLRTHWYPRAGRPAAGVDEVHLRATPSPGLARVLAAVADAARRAGSPVTALDCADVHLTLAADVAGLLPGPLPDAVTRLDGSVLRCSRVGIFAESVLLLPDDDAPLLAAAQSLDRRLGRPVRETFWAHAALAYAHGTAPAAPLAGALARGARRRARCGPARRDAGRAATRGRPALPAGAAGRHRGRLTPLGWAADLCMQGRWQAQGRIPRRGPAASA